MAFCPHVIGFLSFAESQFVIVFVLVQLSEGVERRGDVEVVGEMCVGVWLMAFSMLWGFALSCWGGVESAGAIQ